MSCGLPVGNGVSGLLISDDPEISFPFFQSIYFHNCGTDLGALSSYPQGPPSQVRQLLHSFIRHGIRTRPRAHGHDGGQ